LPEIDATLNDLKRGDLIPFLAALGSRLPGGAGRPTCATVRSDPELPRHSRPKSSGSLLRRRLNFSGLVLSDDLEDGRRRRHLGYPGAARRFLSAGGDLALVCRRADARRETLAAIGRDIDRGALDLAPALRRRQAVRRLLDTAGPRPDVSVIGCAEHRALAEEVARRSAARA